MTNLRAKPWVDPAIRAAAAGFGAVIAGPIGGAVGGWVVNALGTPGLELIAEYVGKFGEKATEKLLEAGGDSLADKAKAHPLLEGLYREALRLSLVEIHSRVPGHVFDDWFNNWDFCLTASISLDPSEIDIDQLALGKLDSLFRHTMERLDAQGAAIHRKDLSLAIVFRTMPNVLLSELEALLPAQLEENFRALIVIPEYEQAWKQTQLAFLQFAKTAISSIDEATQRIDNKLAALQQVAEDAAATRKLVEGFFISALQEGRVTTEQLQAKDAEIVRLGEELRQLYAQLSARSAEPGDAELSTLLSAGDLIGALRLKTQQVNARSKEAHKLPDDLFELGNIHQLRFDWSNALAAYREAWRLNPDPKYGVNYAYCAQMQNRFSEAIEINRTLCKMHLNPSSEAGVLNNLGILYTQTRQWKEAKRAYGKAIFIRRQLAKADPSASRLVIADMAGTLCNLAELYKDMRRWKEAERTLREALSTYDELAKANPGANPSDIAHVRSILASVFKLRGEVEKAEGAYQEALTIYRELAKANPAMYCGDVALTLSYLAGLFLKTQRQKEAKEAYEEALTAYRDLANVNPEACLPDVATLLVNLAEVYSRMGQMKEADTAYEKGLDTIRELAKANPEVFRCDLASTLDGLGNHYAATGRKKEAEAAYQEALTTYRDLAKINSEAYLPRLSTTLFHLGDLYCPAERALDPYREALKIRDALAKTNPKVFSGSSRSAPTRRRPKVSPK